MPAPQLIEVVALVKRRQTRATARARSYSQRVVQIATVCLGAISIAAAVIAIAAFPAYLFITQGLPPVEKLQALLNPLNGALLRPTRFYDRSGAELILALESPKGQRTFVAAIENRNLAAAFVASQDPLFWAGSEGSLFDINHGPTGLTEKLVARLLLADESESWTKTLRGRVLAGGVISRYGRAQILNWALNSANFGHWTFGVESAAQLYFGKPALDLSLGESALLAAVAQAPALNPLDAPELAIEYQQLVLASMLTQGLISDSEYEAAFTEVLVFSTDAEEPASLAPAFTALALGQLEAELGAERVQLGGLTVVTTLDFALQQEVNAIVGGTDELAVLNPINGQVLTLQGPEKFDSHGVDNMLTPFVYLSLFAAGQSPADLVWDLPKTSRFAASAFQGPLTMRAAMAAGLLSPIQGLTDQAGKGKLESLHATFSIRQNEATPLQLAAAYSVFANNGFLAGRTLSGFLQPSAILFVGDAEDEVVLNWIAPELLTITNPELAYLITDVLADVSVRPASLSFTPSLASPLAMYESDGWHAAYSPQRAIVLWSGGADASAEVWTALLESAQRGLPAKNWQVPSGLTSLVVCVPSGLMPDEDCPQTRRELFVRGSEPTVPDALFQRIAINSANGRRATVYTPEEFVEERVYIRLPVEALRWGRAAGFEQPSDDYDTVSLLELQSGPLIIAEPAPFSPVSGMVDITGILAANSVTYDIQVGQGLRPTEWILLAEGDGDGNAEIEWDTAGLTGIWAIQLQAWDENRVLTRVYTIVTID